MGERRRYRRLKMRLPLSFTVLEPVAEETDRKAHLSTGQRINGETYDISTEGLTIDVMLSPRI